MISKNTIKLIKSLSQKKYRHKHRLFLAEGDKNVVEALQSEMNVEQLFATDGFIQNNRRLIENAERTEQASPDEIKRASLLKTPQNCLALCTLPDVEVLPVKPDDFSFYLDRVRDPGNLGTIIRTCDWFGISQLFCSEDTVDIFNPKAIQATMGSFCRIKIFYTGFEKVEKMANLSGMQILGTFMDGRNIYQNQLPEKALVVLGNEGSGIRKEIENAVTQKISIPRFTQNNDKPESLNVAVSAAIICSEFKRKSTN